KSARPAGSSRWCDLMGLTQVPITGTFRDLASNAVTGTIVFQLSANAANSGSKVTLPTKPITITLTSNGTIPSGTTVYATDDTDTAPSNLYVEVTEKLSGTPQRKRLAQVPASASNGGLDYSQIVWLTPTAPSLPEGAATVAQFAG